MEPDRVFVGVDRDVRESGRSEATRQKSWIDGYVGVADVQRTQFVAGEAVLTDEYPARLQDSAKFHEQSILSLNAR